MLLSVVNPSESGKHSTFSDAATRHEHCERLSSMAQQPQQANNQNHILTRPTLVFLFVSLVSRPQVIFYKFKFPIPALSHKSTCGFQLSPKVFLLLPDDCKQTENCHWKSRSVGLMEAFNIEKLKDLKTRLYQTQELKPISSDNAPSIKPTRGGRESDTDLYR